MYERFFCSADLNHLAREFSSMAPPSDNPAEILAQWEEAGAGIDAVVTGWDSPPISEEMLAMAPSLRVVVHSGGSIKPFIPDCIWDRGVRIATANDSLGKGVAETTLGYILAGLKGFFPLAQAMREPGGKWQECVASDGLLQVRELYNVKIGVIGASRTGRHLIRLLKAFDVELLLTDPTIEESEALALGCDLVKLDDLMERADVVSLHAPALPELRHMLGRAHFVRMKPGAIFINTARGMLVDEDALIAELQTGRISAILDVTNPEPPPAESPLRELPNVVLLPHIAGAISNGCYRQGNDTIAQLYEWKQGHPMHGELTEARMAVMA